MSRRYRNNSAAEDWMMPSSAHVGERESFCADEIQSRRVRHRHRFCVRPCKNLDAAWQIGATFTARAISAMLATISGPTCPRKYGVSCMFSSITP
ncbi:MAG: hypothetical protein WDN00_07260 [Limisphaerales bacterium]